MIGKQILHYRILKKLGEGGMGVVYLAEDTKLERQVAIKFLPHQIAASEEERKRFNVEAQAAAALNHPNIATIHAIEEVDDEMFIVMEYIDGKELRDVVETHNHASLPMETTINYAMQIAEGLQAAHEKGIVHRDIKSSNIMINDKGQVKVMDFGLAKVRGGAQLTKEQSTIGTAAYMSPEQSTGGEIDHRTDIFSLGVVLYEMFSGQVPFRGEYDQAVIYSILNEEPQPISELQKDIPKNIAEAIHKCLQKKADDRYHSAQELVETLRGEAQNQKPPSTKSSQIRQFAKIAAFTLLISIGWLIYFNLFHKGEIDTKERVPIAVVDFVNQTGEPELNGLSGMLITALEQSRRLAVMSRARMYDEFKQMNRPDLQFLNEETGREIAKRANLSALAVATIRNFDDLYTIDFKVVEPQTGDRLFSTNVEGEGKKSIPGLLDQLSEKTRIDLKEKPDVIKLTSQGVGDVTTTNLEAYHHYFLGEQLMSKLDPLGAREEYEKAIALDSTFGLAYYRLANAYSWGFAEEFAKEPLAKAFELIDRIPEKERYLLRGVAARVEKGYAAGIPVIKEMEPHYPDEKEMLYFIADWSHHANQHEQAIKYFEKVLAIDPKHEPTLLHLGLSYGLNNQHEKVASAMERLREINPSVAREVEGHYYYEQGEFDKAVESLLHAYDLDSTSTNVFNLLTYAYERPGKFKKGLEAGLRWLELNPVPLAYWNVADSYRLLGQLARADSILQVGIQHFPDSWIVPIASAFTGLKGDYDLAEKGLKATITRDRPPAMRGMGYRLLADFYLFQGKFLTSARMSEECIALTLTGGDRNTAAEHIALKAYRMYLGWGNKNQVNEELQRTHSLTDLYNEDYYSNLAQAYMLIGKFIEAEKAASHVTHGQKKLEIESHKWMAKKDWDRAIETQNLLINKWHAKARTYYGYRNALCYYEKGDYDKAIEEVNKAVSFYGWKYSYVYPMSFNLLGKVYEQKGDTQRALENTEKFLDLWKGADPDLPDLIDAKQRLARLKEVTAK